jgi:hypothetical protein
MSGPVWRFDAEQEGRCEVCLRLSKGLFLEGEVRDNTLEPVRAVCTGCMRTTAGLVVTGESGSRVAAPAYAHTD